MPKFCLLQLQEFVQNGCDVEILLKFKKYNLLD